ncbi:SDR family NAD(P)-dependent oxidoreductase [Streptosporangium sp. NPDC002524]|uniref:type I polyketide synthase n=1 Tax=Streptosporangium sp. NPDC002524 TaxID=3154537 RepID=UPI00332C8C9E
MFAERFAECAEALSPLVDFSVVDAVRGGVGLDRVEVVQPVLWAVMVSLAQVWRSFGVEPVAVVGHSQGEIAAAVVSGGLSLGDGARVVALRSRLLAGVAGRGGMASVALSARQVEERIGAWGGLSVAAENGPASTVVSGEAGVLAGFVAECEGAGVRSRLIAVDYASHSAQMEEIGSEVMEALAGISPQAPRVPFFSTVSGRWLDEPLDGGYWFRNLRERVRFAQATQGLIEAGHRVFVEVSPHPVLTVGVEQSLEAAGVEGAAVGTLRRDEGGMDRFLLSLGEAFVHGVEVDWSPAFGDALPDLDADLPTYPFQRKHYWLRPVEPAVAQDTWGYDVAWHPVTDTADTVDTADTPAGGALTGEWLVLAPAGDHDPVLVRAAAKALERHGARPVTLVLDGAADRDEVVRTLTGRDRPAGILSLLAFDEDPHARHPAVPAGVAGLLALVQALAETGWTVPLWSITSGAVSTGSGDPVRRPVHAETWGLARVAALEQPRVWGGLADLPETLDDTAWDRLCGVLAGLGDEDQVAIRDTGVLVRRLVRAPLTAPARFRTSGTALVTGGTGALAPHLARWLAARGAEHIVLASRRGTGAEGVDALAGELAERGVTVTTVSCDVADRDAVAALLDRLRADGHSPRTVVHAASAARLASLAETTVGEFADAVAAKVHGATHLDELLDHDRLDAFVLFSSIAGVWGSGDHGAYAAANAFLDAYAVYGRGRPGHRPTSVAWGVWDSERLSEQVDAERLRRQGLPSLDPATALDRLDRVLTGGAVFAAVADVDWETFTPVFASARPRPLVADLADLADLTGTRHRTDESENPDETYARRLATLPPAEQERELLRMVIGHVAEALGHTSPRAIGADRAFRELGFESLTAVELRNRLNAATGLRLPVTVVFEHANPAALAGHMRSLLVGAEPSPHAELDRLEAAVTSLRGEERAVVAERLTALLAKLGTDDSAPGDSTPGDEEDDDLSSATDDEIFDLIDRELGA